jgi:hypothetical protein
MSKFLEQANKLNTELIKEANGVDKSGVLDAIKTLQSELTKLNQSIEDKAVIQKVNDVVDSVVTIKKNINKL